MLNTKEYILKVAQICKENEERCGKHCPLEKFMCGQPTINDEIDNVIEFVENYKPITHYCPNCNKEFYDVLIDEYNITNCPWCGTKLNF